jgi:hypothetical protein
MQHVLWAQVPPYTWRLWDLPFPHDPWLQGPKVIRPMLNPTTQSLTCDNWSSGQYSDPWRLRRRTPDLSLRPFHFNRSTISLDNKLGQPPSWYSLTQLHLLDLSKTTYVPGTAPFSITRFYRNCTCMRMNISVSSAMLEDFGAYQNE